MAAPLLKRHPKSVVWWLAGCLLMPACTRHAPDASTSMTPHFRHLVSEVHLASCLGELDRALLLAVQLVRRQSTAENEQLLACIVQSADGWEAILHGHQGRPNVAFSEDGELFLTSDDAGMLRFWKRAPLTLIHERAHPGERLFVHAVSMDGALAAVSRMEGLEWLMEIRSITREFPVRARVRKQWDEELEEFVPLTSCDFSQDGTRAVSCAERSAVVFRTSDGEVEARYQLEDLCADARFVSDGSVVLASFDGAIVSLSGSTLTVTKRWTMPRPARVVLSPTGTWAVAAYDPGYRTPDGAPSVGSIWSFRSATGDVIATQMYAMSYVSVAASEAPRAAVMAVSDEGLVSRHELAPRVRERIVGVDPWASLPEVRLSTNGEAAAVVGDDGRIELIDVHAVPAQVDVRTCPCRDLRAETGVREQGVVRTSANIDAACRIANRDITKSEWSALFGDEPWTATCPRP